MDSYQNKEGSTGTWKDGAFVPFKTQAEADKAIRPAKTAEVEADEPDSKPAPKK